MSELSLDWPAANGQLKKVRLNGDVWAGLMASPATLTAVEFSAFNADVNRRTIPPGGTKTLELEFENDVVKDPSLYSVSVWFGTGAVCLITFP